MYESLGGMWRGIEIKDQKNEGSSGKIGRLKRQGFTQDNLRGKDGKEGRKEGRKEGEKNKKPSPRCHHNNKQNAK